MATPGTTLKGTGRMRLRKVAMALGFPSGECYSAAEESLIDHILKVGKNPTKEQVDAIKAAASTDYETFVEVLGIKEGEVEEKKVKRGPGRPKKVDSPAGQASAGGADPTVDELVARLDALGSAIDSLATQTEFVVSRAALIERGLVAILCCVDQPYTSLEQLPDFQENGGGEE